MGFSEPKLDEVNGKWVVNVFYDNGNLKESLEFDTEDEAIEKREKLVEKDGKKIVKQEKEKIEKKSTFLESMADMDDEESIIPKDNIFGGDTEQELQKKIDTHKSEFEEEETKCNDEAKNLLLQLAQVYLDGDFIKDSEYLKFKMQLESKGLAGLVFQLNITRRAVFRLSEKIHTDEATPRHFEVLTGMNRIILDITKYQHEHLSKLEESMKRFSVDADEAKSRKGSDDNKVLDAEGTVIDTRSRKQLLGELNDMIKEVEENKIPKSRNTRLHDDDPNVEEIEYPNYEEDEKDINDPTDEGGLATWEDEEEEGATSESKGNQ